MSQSNCLDQQTKSLDRKMNEKTDSTIHQNIIRYFLNWYDKNKYNKILAEYL